MATFIAFIKTIPGIIQMINSFIQIWFNHQDAQTDKYFDELNDNEDLIARRLSRIPLGKEHDPERREILRRQHYAKRKN